MPQDWFNLENFTNTSSFLEIFRVANEYTNNMFGTLFLLGFFVMLVIITGKYEFKHRLTVAAWATGAVGIVYVPLGLVNTWVVYMMVILFVGGFVGLFVGE